MKPKTKKMTMTKKNKIVVGIVVCLAVIVVVSVVFDTCFSRKTYEKSSYSFGSLIDVKISSRKDENDVIDVLEEKIDELDKKYISPTEKQSEIFALNKNKNAILSDTTLDILKKSIEISRETDGLFDVTLGSVVNLYHFNDNARLPDPDDIKDALKSVDYKKIKIENKNVSIEKNTCLDFGAVGKGYALDIAKKILDENNIDDAIVDVGGSVLLYNHGKEKTVAIKTPKENDASYFAKIKTKGVSFVSTSGSYEKFIDIGGKRYHHILSPETGLSYDTPIISCTVVADSGFLADSLSTVCFCLGKENSIPILKKHNAAAVFVDNKNNVYTYNAEIEIVNEEYSE